MKHLFSAAILLIALVLGGCSSGQYGYKIKNHQIVYNTPPRPAGQQSMLGFACDPIEHVRVGMIGLGDRGQGAVKRYTYLEDATVVALCDLYPDRVEKAQLTLEKRGAPRGSSPLFMYRAER